MRCDISRRQALPERTAASQERCGAPAKAQRGFPALCVQMSKNTVSFSPCRWMSNL